MEEPQTVKEGGLRCAYLSITHITERFVPYPATEMFHAVAACFSLSPASNGFVPPKKWRRTAQLSRCDLGDDGTALSQNHGPSASVGL